MSGCNRVHRRLWSLSEREQTDFRRFVHANGRQWRTELCKRWADPKNNVLPEMKLCFTPDALEWIDCTQLERRAVVK